MIQRHRGKYSQVSNTELWKEKPKRLCRERNENKDRNMESIDIYRDQKRKRIRPSLIWDLREVGKFQ